MEGYNEGHDGSHNARISSSENLNGRATSPRKSVWKTYQQWVMENQRILWFMDESVSRLLFWAPAGSSTRWREMLLGLLELHRISVHSAITTANHTLQDHSFGTSVEVYSGSDGDKNFISTTSLRLGIALVHSLWPLTQELVRVLTSSSRNPTVSSVVTNYRQAVVRRYLEWIRFILRVTLLVRYWKRLHHLQKNRPTGASTVVLPGLLLRGGGLYSTHTINEHALSYDHERARIERNEYVGRRTGRRISFENAPISKSKTPPRTCDTSMRIRLLRIVLGELLYIIRPLVQAESDVVTCNDDTAIRRLRSWALCLGMDVLSLLSISGECSGEHPPSNAVTVNEWKRRQMRLLLYVLRSPIWDRYTEPVVQRLDDVVYRVPLVGGLLRNFIWDWIYYWKVFRAEEG